jgi:hypothetical protein
MLNKTMTTILITLLTLSMLLAVIPMASAITATTISPGFGPVGTTVTIAGDGASAGGSIYVYWENLGGAVLNSTAYADGLGGYSVKAIIPTAVAGVHSLIVKDVSTGTTVGKTFTIAPKITLTPTSGIPLDSIAVAGTGFAATNNLGIFFDYPGIRFRNVGTATAAWATAPGPGHGTYSASLSSTGGENEAKVSVYINTTSATTLSAFDPANIEFDYWLATGTAIPEFELRFLAPTCINPDDELSTMRGHVDITLTSLGTGVAGAWTTKTGMTTSTAAFGFGNDDVDGTPGLGPYTGDFAAVRTAITGAIAGSGDWKLAIVSVQVGWSVASTVYADKVKVGSLTYDLEPAKAETTTSALGSFTSSFIVPAGTYAEYTVSAIDKAGNNATAPFIRGAAITLTPTTGPTGTVVTIVGRGFGAVAYAVGIKVATFTAVTVPATITSLTDGTFTGQFIVPQGVSIGNDQNVVALQATTATSATAKFNVTGIAGITLTPTTGAVGAVVTIAGGNFTAIAGKAVTVTFSGILVATLSTNATGGFSGTFTVPSLGPLAYTVTATDTYSSLTASTSFTVATTFLTISPVKDNTGTVATVIGYGFTTAGGYANVTIGTQRVLTNILDTALIGGTQTFIVPTLPVGIYTVTALDSGLLTASTTYEVNGTTTLTFSPSSILTTSTVTANAKYFTETTGVALTFTLRNATYSTALTITPAAGYTAGQTLAPNGNYTGTFTVASLSLGSYTINATDANGLTVESSFTIVAPSPAISLDSYEKMVGAVVTVTGASLRASATVTIYFGSTLVKTATSTSGGSLSTSFTVPGVSYGIYNVSAFDGVNTVYAPTNFTVLGVYGIDTITTIVTAIEAKLDQYGSFWNFTNNWFATINAKLGTFLGNDTVASLLYTIKAQTDTINSKLNLPSELKFDFGGDQAAFQTDYIHITNTTAYSADLGYGWLSATGMSYRNRGTENYAETGFVFSNASKTFQVDLPNGNYTVAVTQGDATFGHDNMTITANSVLVGTVSTVAGGYKQTVFTVSVTGGNLQITIGKAASVVDPNWVLNGVVIYRSWNK